MMAWWLANIEGDATYAGDGKVWPKYLQWWVCELHTAHLHYACGPRLMYQQQHCNH